MTRRRTSNVDASNDSKFSKSKLEPPRIQQSSLGASNGVGKITTARVVIYVAQRQDTARPTPLEETEPFVPADSPGDPRCPVRGRFCHHSIYSMKSAQVPKSSGGASNSTRTKKRGERTVGVDPFSPLYTVVRVNTHDSVLQLSRKMTCLTDKTNHPVKRAESQ